MARLTLIHPDDATGDAAEVLAALPVKLNIFRMLAHAESCVLPQVRLGTAILSSLDLGHRRRELLILLVARIEGGAYEWRQHVPIALGVGVPQSQIDAIEQANLAGEVYDHEVFDNEVFDDAERALLAFGKQVIEAVRVEESVFTEVRRHFSEREIVEAILVIGFYMTMARLTEVTETDLDPASGMTVFDSLQPRDTSA
ncbi:carboxymuconolactone decarboxylase family protein [Nonomuraea sp. NPDC050680]|uniref:carboxymuconolactone decarboxylase family protein n=1 Tax=Nonomuraea sp. NPDC050680 TaxID=3154630 RepID=UPI0033D0077D